MNIKQIIGRLNKLDYFPKYSKWIFLLLLLILSCFYNYHEILFKSPQSVHLWRQCDCLSITLNYYQDDRPFFKPAVHNLGTDGTGKTVSDFPMIYYMVAQLWELFGPHELLYRLFIVLLFFTGLFALFRLFENRIKDSIVAIILTLLMFTSPTLVYYANNFLMDIPAFSLALIGLYYFVRFYETGRNKYLYLFSLFFALAGLLKISSLLAFIAIIGLYLLERIHVRVLKERNLFHQPGKQVIPLIAVLIIQLIWYSYAHWYNSEYNSGFFLIGTLPIWKLNPEEILQTFNAIGDHIRWDYFRRETQVILVLMLICVIVFYRRMNKLLFYLTLIVSIGVLLFVILFFQALKDHDYYTINLFILAPLVMLSFFNLLRENFESFFSSLWLKILLLVFLVHNVDFTVRRMKSRYKPDGWHNKEYITTLRHYEDINPYLRSIGITKKDRVISLSDNSINVTLYLMNRKGWTNFNIHKDPGDIRDKIDMGAGVLLIHDRATKETESLQPFMDHRLGSYKNIDIYSLKNEH